MTKPAAFRQADLGSAVDRLNDLFEYLVAMSQPEIVHGGRKVRTEDLRIILMELAR